MNDLSDDQIARLWVRCYDRMKRQFAGGTSFGIDWATLRVVSPSWYKTLRNITAEIKRRVDNGSTNFS